MNISRHNAPLIAVLLVISCSVSARGQEVGTVEEKDVKIIHFEELNYPTFAHAAHIEGVVVVRVMLDDRGNVVKAVTLSGNQVLIPNCIANARKWKFQPNVNKMAVIVYDFTIPSVLCGPYTSFFTFRPPNFVTVTGCPPLVEP